MANPVCTGVRRVPALLSIAVTWLFVGAVATAQETPTPAPAETTPTTPTGQAPAPEGELSLDIEVVAKKLNEARINIEPRIGASTYTLTPDAIQNLPGGAKHADRQCHPANARCRPGQFGQWRLHIRNEHLNVQYRIDGVIIPDGVSFFGQDLSLRFVNSMPLITGEFAGGIRAADRRHHRYPKQERSLQSRRLGRTCMAEATPPSIRAWRHGGAVDGYNYFVTGSYLQSDQWHQ